MHSVVCAFAVLDQQFTEHISTGLLLEEFPGGGVSTNCFVLFFVVTFFI